MSPGDTFMARKMLIVILLFAAGCAGGVKHNGKDAAVLESENHVLRRQLILIERRNGILEEENIQKKKIVRDYEAKLDNVTQELKAEKERFDREMSLLEKKYGNLKKKNEILEKQSSEKITELTELNRKLELDMTEKINKLNQDIRAMESSYSDQIEKLRKQSSETEYNLSLKIEELKKNIIEKDSVILNLESGMKKIREELAHSEADRTQKDTALKNSAAKVDEMSARIKELEEKISKAEESAAK